MVALIWGTWWPVWGQTSQPNFEVKYRFSNRSGETTDGVNVLTPGAGPVINNVPLGIVGWQLSYDSEGFSGISIAIETNTRTFAGVVGASQPSGTWTTFSGTDSVGTLPLTSTARGTYAGYAYYPYIRINLSTHTGTGTVEVSLKGWKSTTYIAGTGGGSGGGISSINADTTAAQVLAGTTNQLTVTSASGTSTLAFPTGGVTLPGVTTIANGSAAAPSLQWICSGCGKLGFYKFSEFALGFPDNSVRWIDSGTPTRFIDINSGNINIAQTIHAGFDITFYNAAGPGSGNTVGLLSDTNLLFGPFTGGALNTGIVRDNADGILNISNAALALQPLKALNFQAGVGLGVAGTLSLVAGTLPPSFLANSFSFYSPTSISTSYQWKVPNADAAGVLVSDGVGTPGTLSIVPTTGTGNILRASAAGGSPGGSTNQFQINAGGGVFGGSTGITYDITSVNQPLWDYRFGGVDDLTSGGSYTDVANPGAIFTVTIDGTGTPNTFLWLKNGAGGAATVSITGASQNLSDGVTVTFASTTGHTNNETWRIFTANKRINGQDVALTRLFSPGLVYNPTGGGGNANGRVDWNLSDLAIRTDTDNFEGVIISYEGTPSPSLITQFIIGKSGGTRAAPINLVAGGYHGGLLGGFGIGAQVGGNFNEVLELTGLFGPNGKGLWDFVAGYNDGFFETFYDGEDGSWKFPAAISDATLSANTIVTANGSKVLTSLANATGALTNNGSGGFTWKNGGISTVTTVGSLGTCNGSNEGEIKGATDLLTPAFLVTVVGGGAVHGPTYCNGTNWIAF